MFAICLLTIKVRPWLAIAQAGFAVKLENAFDSVID